MPLAQVENQAFVHYFKGSLALNALRDYIGEERLNSALRSFLQAYRFQGPPYPTSRDLLRFIEEALPAVHGPWIEDLFETITLWDLRVAEATYRELEDGRYAIRVRTDTRKHRADGRGETREIPMDDLIDIGIFVTGDDGTEIPILLEKRHFAESETIIEVIVEQRPVRAAIDPFHKLIDRRTADNWKAVEAGATP